MPWRWGPTSSQALLPLSPPPPLRPTSLTAHTPYGRGALLLTTDVVVGPPAVVAAAVREAQVFDGSHPLWERRHGVFVVVDGRLATNVVQPYRGVNTIPLTQRAQFMHK